MDFVGTIKRERKAAAVVAVVLAVSAFLLVNGPTRHFLTSPTALREAVLGAGATGPILLIAYHIVQVVFPTLPGLAVDITNGYLYGPLGIAVSLIGILIGSAISLLIARTFGRPIVESVLRTSRLEPERFLGQRSLWFFFAIFLIPGMPHDALTYVVGLVRAPMWKLLLIVMVGRLPTTVGAVLLGATGSNLSPLTVIAITVGLLLVLTPVLRKMAKHRMDREHPR